MYFRLKIISTGAATAAVLSERNWVVNFTLRETHQLNKHTSALFSSKDGFDLSAH